MPEINVEILPDPDAVSRAAAERLAALAAEAVAARERCTIVLAGGETPQGLYRLLAQPPYLTTLPWTQFHFYWGDERCVPPDDPESNYYWAHRNLLAHVATPPGQIHRIHGELDPASAAADYIEELRRSVHPDNPLPWPRFDLVLLGLGGDGHTASLFPGPPAPHETIAPVIAVEAHYEDRPADRVTLTPLAFDVARNVFFLVTGAGKAEAVAGTLSARDTVRWPAQRIHPQQGSITWLVDTAAASRLRPSTA